MVQNTIEALLRQKLGLDANSVGSRLIERAVEQRQIACGLTDRAAYLDLVRSTPQELNHLIEAVVVPETWFFRDKEPFEYLRQFVKEQYDAIFKDAILKDAAFKTEVDRRSNSIAPGSILRVLSVPCSTGEEPYSIAMTLLDAGLKTAQFQIDAVDISQQALIKARAGIYRKKSFRGGAIQNLEHYFQVRPEGFAEGYEVRPIVRESIQFIQGNLLEPHFLMGKQYHAIFCRNLLIYLDDDARDRVLDSLDRALLPLGLMFLGAAETGEMADRPYQAIDHPFAFAYRKAFLPHLRIFPGASSQTDMQGKLQAEPRAASQAAAKDAASPTPLKRKETVTHRAKMRLPNPAKLEDSGVNPALQSSPSRSVTPSQTALSPLEQVRQLADRGQLTQAAQLCESYVRAHPAQSIAYLLLGEIYQGLNQPKQAERCFQKAIYLNPNDYRALVHLALLKEQQGNWVESQRLKRRAQRLVDQGYEQFQSGS